MTVASATPRLRLSTTAGWPAVVVGAVEVGVSTPWANPFSYGNRGRAASVRLYEAWMRGAGPDERRDSSGRTYSRAARLAELHTLAGRHLACWCPFDQPCHAEVLGQLVAEATAREVV